MKTVVFQADAEAEMIEVAAYYEAQQCNLGRRFLASATACGRCGGILNRM